MRRLAFALALASSSLVIAASGLAGCQSTERADAPPSAAEAAAEAAAAADATAEPDVDSGVDPRDQYTLAHAIASARSAVEDREGALARTRSAWIGRRYRWEMAFVPALCGAAGSCVVMPFDHQRDPEHPIRQGWLPQLELSDDERGALREACEGKARCVLELSGTLSQFELSSTRPTSLKLSGVQLHGSRAATPSESWVLSVRPPAARAEPRTPDPRAEERVRASIVAGLG